MTILKKYIAFVVSVLLCMTMAACETKKREPMVVPSQGGNPILPTATQPVPSVNDFTAVYVTVFEDTAIIATHPVMENPDPNVEPENKEPACPPRELSDGGSILCGGDHETECPITRVLIYDSLVPKSMGGWFRNMANLKEIIGLEKVKTHHVTDMSYLFAGCSLLNGINIDGWDVSAVTDFTGIFQDCTAYKDRPSWYAEENDCTLG